MSSSLTTLWVVHRQTSRLRHALNKEMAMHLDNHLQTDRRQGRTIMHEVQCDAALHEASQLGCCSTQVLKRDIVDNMEARERKIEGRMSSTNNLLMEAKQLNDSFTKVWLQCFVLCELTCSGGDRAGRWVGSLSMRHSRTTR